MAPLTLLTDFGLQDPYVGVMKGVIATLVPTAQVIDLSHQIPPQDVVAARLALILAYPYFPAGTVHVVVVDPGVGTDRRELAIALPQGYLVGPDNGVLMGVVQDQLASPPVAPDKTESLITAVALTQPQYWRTPTPSRTFHGRDIFAPVAAHLALGVPITALGPEIPVPDLVTLPLDRPEAQSSDGVGQVQGYDRFGNLITTLPAPVPLPSTARVLFKNETLPIGQTYGEVPIATPLALVGSHGWIEIAVNQGSAQAHFQAQVGDRVNMLWE
ncbi:S-adenosyl-l-methionine hydroxide adenosyltransferase family protein [Leptolyngbya sp. PCC 6406]|uniref:SAM hydrolase/SAM-dependent halogenase family protein n=1 Tax=Leptolyngbya sp. PCC 6406 TaxID=1173264 RepID=UPI0002ABEB3A|nr:SAM-dependent chlorinase/fluorinase [Leptolyngbya sp. PCC 6406]